MNDVEKCIPVRLVHQKVLQGRFTSVRRCSEDRRT